MKILLSAAEASSDVHGAELLNALKATAPEGETVEAIGAGGPYMARAGQRQAVDARELLAMGLFAVFARLPAILSALKKMKRLCKSERPDLAVLMDYPGFHFRFARSLFKMRIPAVYYIPPKVWVWKKWRVRFLAKFFRKVLCIFPFEEKFYRGSAVQARFVGNPLLDSLPLNMSTSEARITLGVQPEDLVLTLMPGSRPAELSAHFPTLLDAANQAAQKMGRKLKVLIPMPATLPPGQGERWIEEWKTGQAHLPSLLDLKLSYGNAAVCLLASDAGVIKSGTSTLEAAVLGCPHVIVYQASRIAGWIFKNIIRYRGPVGLANLAVLEDAPGPVNRSQLLFRELILQDFRLDLISAEIVDLFQNSSRKKKLKEESLRLRQKMCGDGRKEQSPSHRAAHEIWEVYHSTRVRSPSSKKAPRGPSAILNGLISFAWSSINALMRSLIRFGWIHPEKLPSRVISVGNIQAGGTGKTPLVTLIAQEAIQKGLVVCILSRGYRSEWETQGGVMAPQESAPAALICGDEPRLLRDLVPAAWIGVGANRIRQYQAIVSRIGKAPDLVILDDGFQNWKIKKDLDVVAITSMSRTEKLFRDWKCSLKAADLVVWTKGSGIPKGERSYDVRVSYSVEPPQWNRPVVLVTGVGDGEFVRFTAEQAGYRIVRHLSFPDHAVYSEAMIRSLLKEALAAGAQMAITGKDWVKWRDLLGESNPSLQGSLLVLEPKLTFLEGRDLWSQTLWGN